MEEEPDFAAGVEVLDEQPGGEDEDEQGGWHRRGGLAPFDLDLRDMQRAVARAVAQGWRVVCRGDGGDEDEGQGGHQGGPGGRRANSLSPKSPIQPWVIRK